MNLHPLESRVLLDGNCIMKQPLLWKMTDAAQVYSITLTIACINLITTQLLVEVAGAQEWDDENKSLAFLGTGGFSLFAGIPLGNRVAQQVKC